MFIETLDKILIFLRSMQTEKNFVMLKLRIFSENNSNDKHFN